MSLPTFEEALPTVPFTKAILMATRSNKFTNPYDNRVYFLVHLTNSGNYYICEDGYSNIKVDSKSIRSLEEVYDLLIDRLVKI